MGILEAAGDSADADLLDRMTDALEHRGPDDRGTLIDGPVGLGSRRLAILDLSPAGHQPMHSEDGRYTFVFNGEIYNYRELGDELRALGHEFTSTGDTTVLVHAWSEWGVQCLERLRGMFAFAVWDKTERRLWLIRDRVGIKPLYYTKIGGALLFASEIKAFRQDARFRSVIRPEAVAQYLSFTHPIDADGTWLQGVHRLPAGSYATLRPGETPVVTSWWDPIELYRNRRDPPDDLRDQLRALLEETAMLHIRSDVPLGAHLSGGLDSSTVVALIASIIDSPIETFSGAFAEGLNYDERGWINLVAERYHTKHREVVPTSQDFQDQLVNLMRHLDEPIVGVAAFSQLMVCQMVKEAGVIVVNGGQGGDEIMGGYPRYLLHGPSDHSARGRLSPLLSLPVMKAHVRRRLYSGGLGRMAAGLHPDLARPLRGYRPRRTMAVPNDRSASEMYFDLRNYLPSLLHVEDRTSMANSLESRVPLVDHRLVELMASIPGEVTMAGGQLKSLFRSVVADLLPKEITDRRDKKGFPTPLGPWLRGPLGDWAGELLLHPALLERRIFSPQFVQRELALHRRGVPMTHPLWTAISVAGWVIAYEPDVSW